jgi:hypothetical protein
MRSILILISILSVLDAQVKFSPVVLLSYLSTGSDFQPSNNDIKLFGAGVKVEYESDNLTIAAKFVNHRLYGSSSRYSLHNFNSNQGLSWGQDPTNSGDSFDYDFADLDVRYDTRNGEFFFGKMNPQWGEGEAKLTFSNKAPSFPLFGFNWIVNENISMEYFHGQLMSGVENENIKYYQDSDYAYDKKIFKSRNIAAHRIIWNVSDKLTIKAMETVIYAIRGLDLHYMIPFIPFWSIQHYLGDTDNIQMAGEIIYSPIKKIKLYGTIFMDEWAPDKTFDKENRNWFGYQSGFLLKNSLIDHDRLRFEYTWTDNRIYRHKFIENDNYSHNYPMGFWAGPHAEELFFSYNILYNNADLKISLSKSKRGEFTNLRSQYYSSIENAIRYDGGVEEKLSIEIEVTKPIYKEFFLTVGISYVDWKNGGFDPSDGENHELQDIQKTSINLSFNYNY